jgi:hypothetical protein
MGNRPKPLVLVGPSLVPLGVAVEVTPCLWAKGTVEARPSRVVAVFGRQNGIPVAPGLLGSLKNEELEPVPEASQGPTSAVEDATAGTRGHGVVEEAAHRPAPLDDLPETPSKVRIGGHMSSITDSLTRART